MFQFSVVQKTNTAKLTTFLQRFHTEVRALRVSETDRKKKVKLSLPLETVLIEIILKSQVTMNQKTTTKPRFKHFCRLVSRLLTFRPQRTHIYIFRVLFN